MVRERRVLDRDMDIDSSIRRERNKDTPESFKAGSGERKMRVFGERHIISKEFVLQTYILLR